jgi:hypothetical protein
MSVKGTISENELMMKLVQAKKVLNKVEGGNYEKTNISEKFLEYNTEDFEEEMPQKRDVLSSSKRIMESKLPDVIKKAMIDNPIHQISLNDSLNLDFVKNTRKLMEAEGVKTTNNKVSQNTNESAMLKQLSPLIENIVRKTVTEILDTKLNQILSAQQTLSINENLVLKVGDSIFKGKITGVNKSK